jgi:hypothetical protein
MVASCELRVAYLAIATMFIIIGAASSGGGLLDTMLPVLKTGMMITKFSKFAAIFDGKALSKAINPAVRRPR